MGQPFGLGEAPRLKLAEAGLAKAKEAMDKAEVAIAEANVEVAEAEVAIAQYRLGCTEVTAPIDGTILAKPRLMWEP